VTAKFTDKRRTDDQGPTTTIGDQAFDLLLPWQPRPDLNRRYRLERAVIRSHFFLAILAILR
jgi:hypothetical protein